MKNALCIQLDVLLLSDISPGLKRVMYSTGFTALSDISPGLKRVMYSTGCTSLSGISHINQGTLRMSMNYKIMFDRYYCILQRRQGVMEFSHVEAHCNIISHGCRYNIKRFLDIDEMPDQCCSLIKKRGCMS